MAVTKEQLAAVINPLGDLEPDEIAAKIKAEVGPHTAICKEPEKCALALYIEKKLGLPALGMVASVGCYSTCVVPTDLRSELEIVKAWHPESVDEFIRMFDQHQYPELEAVQAATAA